MLNKKLTSLESESKLAKTIKQLQSAEHKEKTGFVKNPNKSSAFKTKSFRLREADFVNLSNIANQINTMDDRMSYSDSQIIRGLINFVSDNIDTHLKKILPYVKSSS